MSILFVDIETVPREAALPLLKAPEPKRNLVDPAKIAADVAAKQASLLADMSLDPYACRIVALGTAWDDTAEPHVALCRDEDEEEVALEHFWRYAATAALCGFNLRKFDLRVLIARSLLLQVSNLPFSMQTPDYVRRSRHVIDLYEYVAFGDSYGGGDSVISRSLVSMCRVFGVNVPEDDVDGGRISELVSLGQWDAVAQHCRRDVERTRGLARALRVSAVAQAQAAERDAAPGVF